MSVYLPRNMAAAILAIPNDGCQILVTAPTGATVTATRGNATYNGVENGTTGLFTIVVPQEGSYLLKAVASGVSYLCMASTVCQMVHNCTYSLPNGYTLLEYLESTGTQYIGPRNMVANGVANSYESESAITDLSEQNICGSNSAVRTQIAYFGFDGEQYLTAAHYIGAGPIGVAAKINADTNFHQYYGSDGYQAIDAMLGNQSAGVPSTGNGCYFSLFGCCTYYDSNIVPGKMKMKYLNTYAYATPTNLLLPVRRNSDSALGMFDLVSQTLLTNAGTGTFIARPEITL